MKQQDRERESSWREEERGCGGVQGMSQAAENRFALSYRVIESHHISVFSLHQRKQAFTRKNLTEGSQDWAVGFQSLKNIVSTRKGRCTKPCSTWCRSVHVHEGQQLASRRRQRQTATRTTTTTTTTTTTSPQPNPSHNIHKVKPVNNTTRGTQQHIPPSYLELPT